MSRRLDGLRGLFGRRGLERDVDEELASHVAHRVDDLVAEGVEPAEARRRALAEFGDVERLRRECRGARDAVRAKGVASAGERLRQDLGFAFRQLRRSPGFSAVAVSTLGLGIVATAIVVAVVQAVVLKPLPFARPDRLVYIEEVTPAGHPFSVSEPAYVDWRAQARSFQAMGARAARGATLQGRGEPRSVLLGYASASLLPALGIEPVLGRGFLESEDRPGTREPIALLGHALWQDAFGGDPDVLGQDVVLDGRAFRVIGVLPSDGLWVDVVDLVVPLGANPAVDRGDSYLDVWGRLAPGATLESARAEMVALAEELGRIHPIDAGWSVRLTPAREVLIGPDLTRAGWVLLTAAGLLLAIACVNVSNLLLARASMRRGELAVRAALGAGRARIVRQLFTESTVLAACGGLLGLLATLLVLPLVRGLGDGRIPRLDQAAPSAGVLLSCLGAVAFAAVLFGLAPAVEVGKDGPSGSLRGARGSGDAGGRRLRSALVAGQVALSVVLLVGTGLLLRSFTRLAAVDPGFVAAGTLTLRLDMPDATVSWEERAVLLPEILAAIEAVPGIEHVGATSVAPFSGMNLANFVARQDRMPPDARGFTPIGWRAVTDGFVEAMGMELVAGRSFRPDDGTRGDAPVMIGQSLAERLWPDGDAVGSTLVWGDPEGSRMTVVGVLEDLNDRALADDPMPIVYRPHRQIPWAVMTVVARARGDAAALAPRLREAVRSTVPQLAVPEVRTLEWSLRRATAEPRFHALLTGIFAAAGLALALVGVYGVTAFSVSRRLREIGIRLTLGGDPEAIRRMVLLDSASLAAIGAVVGGGAAWFVGRALESLLFRTQATDLLTWAAVAGLMAGATLLAAWIPARRATRIDPREVLGAE